MCACVLFITKFGVVLSPGNFLQWMDVGSPHYSLYSATILHSEGGHLTVVSHGHSL